MVQKIVAVPSSSDGSGSKVAVFVGVAGVYKLYMCILYIIYCILYVLYCIYT